MINEDDYLRLEKEYLEKQRKIERPSGVMGMWSWHRRAKKAFSEFIGQKPPTDNREPFPSSQANPSSFSEFWKKTQ